MFFCNGNAIDSSYGLAPPSMRWFGLVGHQKRDDGHSTNCKRSSTTCTVAARAKAALAQAVCFVHQTSKCTAASVRHAEAVMDQMMVTQDIVCCGKHGKQPGLPPTTNFTKKRKIPLDL